MVNSTLGGVTLWNGTAFNCSNAENSIKLVHSMNLIMSCGEEFVGWIERMSGNYYISRLNVTISSNIIGDDTINCMHIDSLKRKVTYVGHSIIGGKLLLLIAKFRPVLVVNVFLVTRPHAV